VKQDQGDHLSAWLSYRKNFKNNNSLRLFELWAEAVT